MNKEDKELLLKDLCARLPYRVKFHFNGVRHMIVGIHNGLDSYVEIANGMIYHIESIRPYLLPMSSMTEEQKKELEDTLFEMELKAISNEIKRVDVAAYEIDFYNKHHIDYIGLIEKGLAIDATGMNIY